MTCVLVLGTPRSGTSCVAGVVHHLGISMGTRLKPADIWNPAGYFQDEDFEDILHQALGYWQFPDWTTSKPSLADRFARQIKQLAAQRAALGLPWGVKSNRLIYFMNALIAGAGSDVRVIQTSRPIQDSIDSWDARMPIKLPGDRNPIIPMSDAINRGLTQLGITPALVVDYYSLLADPSSGVTQIAAACGVPVTQEAVDFVNVEYRRFGNE